MAWASAGGARHNRISARVASAARALLASGLLPVPPPRPEHYAPGPLRRAETKSKALLGPRWARVRGQMLRLIDRIAPAVALAFAALLLGLSRARKRLRGEPVSMAAPRSGDVAGSVSNTSGRPPGPQPARRKTRPVLPGLTAEPAVSNRPLRGRRDIVAAGTAALGALTLALALAFLSSSRDVDGSPVETASISERAQVRNPAGAKLEDKPVSAAPLMKPREPYRIAWPFELENGLTFGPEGALKTQLAGLEGPHRDAICNDRDGRPWTCGLQARATLNNVTRRQVLTCAPLGDPTNGTVPARCHGETDVARELVRAGFARPTGPDPALDEALEEARRSERGLWNGGWTIRNAVR